jgi:hypothetical protein
MDQVAEVERAGLGGSLSFQRSEPLTLLRPAPVQLPILRKDVRAELTAGEARNQMTSVDCRAMGARS